VISLTRKMNNALSPAPKALSNPNVNTPNVNNQSVNLPLDLNQGKWQGYNVHRVIQMDAIEVEKQVFSLIVNQVSVAAPTFFRKYEPEIVMGLQLMSYRLSLWKTGMTYGSSLLGLIYRDESKHWTNSVAPHAPITLFQKLGWAIGHIVLKYFHSRLHRFSIHERWSEFPDEHWKKKLWRLMEFSEKVVDILTFLNFVVFLRDGRYSNLIDRLLCMRLVYIQRRMNRPHDMEFLNRQVVWQGFTEFVIFFMSIFSTQSILGRLKKNDSNEKIH